MILPMNQKARILKLLRTYNKVNSHDLTYVYGIKQAPTRIHELQEDGYHIVASKPRPNRSVDYELIKEEVQPMYMWEFKDGMARQVVVDQEPRQEALI